MPSGPLPHALAALEPVSFWRQSTLLGLGATLLGGVALSAPQGVGSIRGLVLDKDFEAPLPEAKVLVVETGASVLTNEQGNYVLADIPPGRYTVAPQEGGFPREGRAHAVPFTIEVRADGVCEPAAVVLQPQAPR